MVDGLRRDNLLLCPLGNTFHRAKLLFVHPIVDLALIQCGGFRVKTPLFPSHERFTGKSGLICLGYAPSQGRDTGQSIMFANAIDSYEREVRVRNQHEEETIVFSAPFMEGGHSGGPILGEGGGVVGVTIEGFSSDGGFRGRATAIHPLMDHLHVA